jgi:hypothetical protein
MNEVLQRDEAEKDANQIETEGRLAEVAEDAEIHTDAPSDVVLENSETINEQSAPKVVDHSELSDTESMLMQAEIEDNIGQAEVQQKEQANNIQNTDLQAQLLAEKDKELAQLREQNAEKDKELAQLIERRDMQDNILKVSMMSFLETYRRPMNTIDDERFSEVAAVPFFTSPYSSNAVLEYHSALRHKVDIKFRQRREKYQKDLAVHREEIKAAQLKHDTNLESAAVSLLEKRTALAELPIHRTDLPFTLTQSAPSEGSILKHRYELRDFGYNEKHEYEGLFPKSPNVEKLFKNDEHNEAIKTLIEYSKYLSKYCKSGNTLTGLDSREEHVKKYEDALHAFYPRKEHTSAFTRLLDDTISAIIAAEANFIATKAREKSKLDLELNKRNKAISDAEDTYQNETNQYLRDSVNKLADFFTSSGKHKDYLQTLADQEGKTKAEVDEQATADKAEAEARVAA